MDLKLSNFIKYCLGYVRLTRQRTFAAQRKFSVNLHKDCFSLVNFLGTDIDLTLGELIDLDTFYSYDPKKVPAELRKKYEHEKDLANAIEEIYNKYKNNQFTKQVILNFGYFEIEIPIDVEENGFDSEEDSVDDKSSVMVNNNPPLPLIDNVGEKQENKADAAVSKPSVKVERYPLFSLPVRIEKEIKEGVGKYFVYAIDPEIQVNISMLEPILGEDLYYQLVEEMGRYEIEGKLVLPMTETQAGIFVEIWHQIKAQLRLREAKFDEDSFSLGEIRLALSPRANYFLAEDLQKLSKLNEDQLTGTALTSWAENDELNITSALPEEKDLFFPFPYDKYQLQVLSIINNKAAIIQGPPGTGKSETIANVLCHLAATGKKVLFVSQKAQALKVVKDKLKRLKVGYLFGYIPNPGSSQLGEEDLEEGIAIQLSALDSYIQKMEERRRNSTNPPIATAVEEKSKIRKYLATVIDSQRGYYQLHEELKNLQDYAIPLTNIARFADNFNLSEWKEIKLLKSRIESLTRSIHEYEKTGQKTKYDIVFSVLDLQVKKYSEALKQIEDDVARTGYDRHIKLVRQINNALRKIRLREIRTKLPREIIDYIDQSLGQDISRRQAASLLDSICHHFLYYENMVALKLSDKALREKLGKCGISNQEFQSIDNIVSRVGGDAHVGNIKNTILRVYEIRNYLNKIEQLGDSNKVTLELKNIEKNCRDRIATYIQNIINKRIIEQWNRGVTIKQIIRKLARAFGKSRKAFKTFDNLRKAPDSFKTILDLIPIWIMELDDASRIIPLEANIFDYVILDESSQCNIAYTLPTMFRSKRALLVGDSEQMRDNTIMFKSNRSFDDLARRYQVPETLQIKATGSAVQSVLDIGDLRGFASIPLRNHYRSPAELIGFSNQYFYKPKRKELIPLNNNYLTYKDTNRIMVIHPVQSDWQEEISDKVNIAEAKMILNLFKELRSDNRYRDKSIGILSFFNAQAAFIRNLFEQEGFIEEEDNYKVSIIEGIQGDEKDVILYSFVIRMPEQKNKYIPLTGEGGDIRGDINQGRVNVAFSRARLQAHCFVSMPINQIPERIWIKKYITYAQEKGEVDFYSTEIKPFDSFFEEDFYNFARTKLGRNYRIQNQIKSCGFKIDFVVSNIKTGNKIAVECDGPTHFKDELDEECGIYVDNDEDRQRVLEAAGWSFYRIKYSNWINENFEKNAVVKEIIQQLN